MMSEQHKSAMQRWREDVERVVRRNKIDWVPEPEGPIAVEADWLKADRDELARLNRELAATVAERDRAQAACEQMGGRIAALEEEVVSLREIIDWCGIDTDEVLEAMGVDDE